MRMRLLQRFAGIYEVPISARLTEGATTVPFVPINRTVL